MIPIKMSVFACLFPEQIVESAAKAAKAFEVTMLERQAATETHRDEELGLRDDEDLNHGSDAENESVMYGPRWQKRIFFF